MPALLKLKNLRNTISEVLCRNRNGCLVGSNNDFDLLQLVHVDQRIVNSSDLHSAVVDLDSVELRGSLESTSRFVEGNGGNATALSVGSICKKRSLDWPNGL